MGMHKLAREVLIPMTTVQERILHLTDTAHVRRLFALLDPETRVLTKSLHLPGADGAMVVVEKGMSIHGSLSSDGVVRRNYWSMGQRRCEQWKRVSEDEIQTVPDRAPEGYAETEQWITQQDVEARVSNTDGVYLVLRRGRCWSECVRRARRITDFISHNWSGSCKDLVDTLLVAEVRTAWLCTLALNQHAIPSLSGDVTKSPFYQALDQMNGKGRVVMVLDRNATTLTRIWCIFEVWVSRILQLPFHMFLPSGEVNFFGDSEECKHARRRIVDLNLQNTEYSRREDYDAILNIIEKSPGGTEAVLWQVKRILSTSAIALLARIVEDTSTFFFIFPYMCSFAQELLCYTCHGDVCHEYTGFCFLPWLYWPLIIIVGLHQLRAWRFFFSFTNGFGTLSALRAVIFSVHRQVVSSSTLLQDGLAGGLGSSSHARSASNCRRTCTRQHWSTSRRFVALCICFAAAEVTVAALVFVSLLRHCDSLKCFEGESQLPLYFPILLTLFLALKVLPWIVGFLTKHVLQRKRKGVFIVRILKEFSVAAPRIGFVVLLSGVAMMQWRWNRHVADRCVRTGLAAWALSIGFDLWTPEMWERFSLSELLSWVVFVCFFALVFYFWLLSADLPFWIMCGTVLWMYGTLLFHHGGELVQKLLCTPCVTRHLR